MIRIILLSLVSFFALGQSVKISDMPAATAPTGTELVPIVQSGANRRATIGQFRGFNSYGATGQLLRVNSSADGIDFFTPTYGDVSTSGSYADPSWITSLNWSKITSRPTTLSGYGITDAWTLASGGTLTGINNIITNAPNQLIFGGTWTSNANNQAGFIFGGTYTSSSTAHFISPIRISSNIFFPTHTSGGSSVGILNITPTINQSGVTGSGQAFTNGIFYNPSGITDVDRHAAINLQTGKAIIAGGTSLVPSATSRMLEISAPTGTGFARIGTLDIDDAFQITNQAFIPVTAGVASGTRIGFTSTTTFPSGILSGTGSLINYNANLTGTPGSGSYTNIGYQYSPNVIAGVTNIAFHSTRGTVLLNSASATPNANTVLDIRGNGTGTDLALRVADNLNVQRGGIQSDGVFFVGASPTAQSAMRVTNGVITLRNVTAGHEVNIGPIAASGGGAYVSSRLYTPNIRFTTATSTETVNPFIENFGSNLHFNGRPGTGTAGLFRFLTFSTNFDFTTTATFNTGMVDVAGSYVDGTGGGLTRTGLRVIPTINITGGTGTFIGYDYDPVLTGTTGLTHIGLRLRSGSALIGGTTLTNNNTILDIQSTTQGVAFPRMTTTQRDAISSPFSGLLVYNTSTNALNFHNGTSWGAVGGGGGLSDGDYGDVTVSGSGTAINVDNQAITYGKIQSVAANTFLANVTGSAATVQEVATNRIPLFSSAITGTPSSTTFLRGDGQWVAPAGSGDVVGPSSATDNAIVRFDAATGKLIQNSSVFISDSGNITIGTDAATFRNIQAAGSGSNVLLQLLSKGTGAVALSTNSTTFNINGTSSGASFSQQTTSTFSGSNGSTGNDGFDLIVKGGNGDSGSGSPYNGGHLYLNYGSKNGTGVDGNIGLLTNSVNNWQSMERGIFIANAATNPTGNPTGGGFLFADASDASRLKWRVPSGTVFDLTAGSGTEAGINMGSFAGPPSSLTNGDMWYDTSWGNVFMRVSSQTTALAGVSISQNFTGYNTFRHNASVSGFRISPVAGNPSSINNGDIWYNSTTEKLNARVNSRTLEWGEKMAESATVIDASFTAVSNTVYYFADGTLTTNRTITIPTGANMDVIEFYNNETAFVWNVAGEPVYLSDNTTTVSSLLANTNYIIRRVNGRWRVAN